MHFVVPHCGAFLNDTILISNFANVNYVIRKAAADGLVSFFRQEMQPAPSGDCERTSDKVEDPKT